MTKLPVPLSVDLQLLEPTNRLLNQKAKAVEPKELMSPYIQSIIDQMLALAAGKGHSSKDSRQMVGLAAPQAGVGKRIITIDVTADGLLKEQHIKVFINPRITSRSAAVTLGREGCWSAGNICGAVERAEEVTVEALDRKGKTFTVQLSGFVARIAQHEVDHLDGIRFPDRIPVDQPDRLHWVRPEEFADYRLNWATWPTKCPRERWTIMKTGGKL